MNAGTAHVLALHYFDGAEVHPYPQLLIIHYSLFTIHCRLFFHYFPDGFSG
jgi:hypothetical protein